LDIETMTVDVPELSPDRIGTFDVVLFLGVFYHLIDPIDGLRHVASLAKEMLVVETHTDLCELDRPAMVMYPGAELAGDATNWWGPNPACMLALLKQFGFEKIDAAWTFDVGQRASITDGDRILRNCIAAGGSSARASVYGELAAAFSIASRSSAASTSPSRVCLAATLSTRLPTDARGVTIERADVDGSACPATGTIDIQPRRSGRDGASDSWRPQGRALSVPAFDDAERVPAGCFVSRALLPEIGDARGFAVRVIVGHSAASIGPSLRRRKGDYSLIVGKTLATD
jgi:hypothetical protein